MWFIFSYNFCPKHLSLGWIVRKLFEVTLEISLETHEDVDVKSRLFSPDFNQIFEVSMLLKFPNIKFKFMVLIPVVWLYKYIY
jgi:hypothetical protein